MVGVLECLIAARLCINERLLHRVYFFKFFTNEKEKIPAGKPVVPLPGTKSTGKKKNRTKIGYAVLKFNAWQFLREEALMPWSTWTT